MSCLVQSEKGGEKKKRPKWGLPEIFQAGMLKDFKERRNCKKSREFHKSTLL